MPCGERNSVPRIFVMPRLVATTKMGANSFSNARFRNEKAFDVEHVHLVDEEHARDDLRLALFLPRGNLVVDLLANLRANFTGITGEEREETLECESL